MSSPSINSTETPQKWVQKKQPDPNSHSELEMNTVKYDLTITELPPENTWDIYKPFNIRSKQWRVYLDKNFFKESKPSKNRSKQNSHLYLPKIFRSITVDYSKFGCFKSKQNSKQ